MINALKALGHNQFEHARWAEKEYDKYKVIPVEIIGDMEKRWSTVIQNMITSANSTLLRTASIYSYAPRQHVMYRGEWYEIRSVLEVPTDVNSQALSLVHGGNSQFILEIVKVNGYDAH